MQTDIEFLQAVNVTKLQTAARMAGLKFKNGTPGYDKAGIIEKLSYHPSIMRATIATINRMDSGSFNAPRETGESFADAIREESAFAAPLPAPSTIPPSVSLPAPSEGDSALRQSIDSALRMIGGLRNDLDPIRAEYCTRTQARKISGEVFDALIPEYSKAIEALKAEVTLLKNMRPVVFTIGEKVSTLPITGQHYLFPKLVQFLESQDLEYRNALLIGPASSGKSRAARAFAELKGLPLYSQPQTVDSFGVLGIETPTKIIITPFAEAWEKGGVLLIDEISMNGADAIGAMNDALAGGYAALPGKGYVKRHPDCYVIAGDNSDTGASAKYSARQVLDGSTLDRFIRMDWPIDPALETSLAGDKRAWLACVRAIRAFIEQRDIEHVGATVRAVIQGRNMLNRGTSLTRLDILESTCKKGILADSWEQILRLPEVSSFLQGA